MKSRQSGELLKGSMDCLLLSLIAERPRYGYQLIKEIEARSRGYFRFREGTIYPALHRLERAGYVATSWERLPGGQDRRYYRMTEEGSDALNEKTGEWRSFSLAVENVLKGIA